MQPVRGEPADPRPASPVPPGLGTLVPVGHQEGDRGGLPGPPRHARAARSKRTHLVHATCHRSETSAPAGGKHRDAADDLNRPSGLLGPRARITCMRGPEGAPVQQCTGATRPSCRCAVRCRGDLRRFEDPADGGCADPVAELEQLALDPLVSPAVVLGGEPLDQRCDLGADRWPSCPVGVGPLAGDQAAVPAQDGAGSDQPVLVRSRAGKSRISVARTAWSAQSSRGRGWVRRSTATSCRSTSSSASLDAMSGRAGPASCTAARR